MGAIFYRPAGGDTTYTISNNWSITRAGFKFVKLYYDIHGGTLEYYINDNGNVLERCWYPRRQASLWVYNNKEEANKGFIEMQRIPHVVGGKVDYSEKRTWETGKWVPKRK